ncbi:family 78 glycoside hydrolase catalytic domain [Paenibacillus cisolokensis]|uniref:family 78 glycoside hydrolase catalytic domain n=1 Tax=Paenibacillus cisolokensis TaxID=1658519 RepID=UPI003D2E2069
MPLTIAKLWIEGRHNPLGIDAETPLFGWSFGPAETQYQRAYRIAVASTEERLANGIADVWDSGTVESGRHTSVRYAGPALEPRRSYFWRVTVWDDEGGQAESPLGLWETGQLGADNWTGRWIGAPAQLDPAKADSASTDPAAAKAGSAEPKTAAAIERLPLPQFRRVFSIRGPVRRARIYISGLGHYELRLNGTKVGDSELDPGWTDYDRTVLYAAHDVTAALRQGENVVGVLLGNGFYNVAGGRYAKFKDSYGEPKCLADLFIEYEDGRTETIGTDRTWRTAPSPLTFSCIYGGEDYDARLEQEGWDAPGFAKDGGWTWAAEVGAPSGKLIAQPSPPVKVMRRFQAAAVTEPKPGIFVYDLGQNFSGWPELETSGPEGARIKLTPAELLTEDGMANQKWSGSPYTLNYTLKGGAAERWRLRFTYYGFRYVQVEGAVPAGHAAASEGKPVVLGIEGQMLYPDVPAAGGFRCSDRMLNRIHELINMAVLSNMKSVFTDCPHREKLGWLEQVHLMGPAVMFNYDIEALLAKVLADIADAQQPNGMVPTTAPEYVVFREPWHMFRDAAAWGGTFILSAWEMLQRYGNLAVLERHYEGMKRYVDYLSAKSDGLILREGLGDWYDIGPKGPGFSQNTPVPLAETAIFYGLAVVMDKIARLLGRYDDASAFERLAASIKAAFNDAFFDPAEASYAEGSDAALAMPLAIGLAPEEHRAALLDRLIRNIEGRGWQTTSGDVGHRYVLLALARGGRSDVIFRMSCHTDKPGYGYQVANGATTLTEAWDGPTVGKSQNHFMLGHLEEWLYTGLAGLDYRYRPDTGRFAVTVKPHAADGIDWAEAWCELRAGRAGVRWEREEGTLKMKVDIPVNAEGTIFIPAASADDVELQGPAAELLKLEAGYAVLRTGSGSFVLTSKIGAGARR